MTKLLYPTEGIDKFVSEFFSQCSQNLSNATKSCAFSVPNDFSYANYVRGLSSEINNYLKELNDIKLKIKDTDSRFDNLDETLKNNVRSSPVSIIEERDRLIK